MARPVLAEILGQSAWDADVDGNFELLVDGPFPIYRAADIGSLPSATTLEDCIAFVIDIRAIAISNGTSWTIYGQTDAIALTDNTGGTPDATLAVLDQTVTGVDGTGSNAASKVDVNACLVTLANSISSLATKINEIRGDLIQQ